MRILCAPDSFKGTLTALQAAQAMSRGIRAATGIHRVDECPIADGGEGTLDALVGALHGSLLTITVRGPLGEPVEARFGLVTQSGRRIAIVELAQASGLTLVPIDQRDPTRTTTFGTGQLIKHAIARGAEEVLVCLGGSATVDGGTGLAQALGAKFFDQTGAQIRRPMCGGLLSSIHRVEKSGNLPRIRAACDVRNPLCGPQGAAGVYGPQKGATPAQVEELDESLRHFAAVIGGDPDRPGMGAAGGTPFGLVHLCGAIIERGADLVLDAIGFDDRCRRADLVLTGEGQLDGQSRFGKACMGVAAHAAKFGISTIAIVGNKGPGWEQCVGDPSTGLLARCVSLTEHFGGDRALAEPEPLIETVVAEIVTQLSVS